ncbi:MAG: gamma-glutamyltransferase [Candidatus Marinimicrobia bacterium]|nr:gamma-glutamyltransferase [Candidatus Neomarinimicrobiota bacterium]
MLKKIIIFIIFLQFNFARFPDAVGYNGAVVSSNKYASQVGIDILKNGGNAIDAAVGVGFALAVVHPGAGNIGGGGFMVIRTANGEVTTIDFREIAPNNAYRDMFLDEKKEVIPGKSWSTSWAAGVPGSVAGFEMAHMKFGTMSWKKILRPSILLAKKGFELDYLNSMYFNSDYYKNYLSQDEITRDIFTKESEFKVGEIFIQKDLGSTLSRISKRGAREFYTGKTADMIVQCMKRTNGLITHDDLSDYKAIERSAISFDYRGYKVYSMPPASSGGIAVAGILNQLENLDFSKIEFHSAKHIHLISEAERRAYADRAKFLGDTDFINVPIDTLISQQYSDQRWLTINEYEASKSSDISHGEIVNNLLESEETTHYSVVDKYGNAVSVTTTINGWFGNGITVDDAGFLLNNEMDDFSAKPGVANAYGLVGGEANAIQPKKRMLSSMTPTIVETPEGELFLVVGSPGGSTIITTVAQIIMNVIDFEMNIEDAVEAPRFHHQWLPDLIQIESFGFSIETLQALSNKGHNYKIRNNIGEANCIMILEDGLIEASSDSRKGASAKAF